MKILYVNLAADMAEEPKLFDGVRHQVISLTDLRHALKSIELESFDAVVVDEGEMHPGTLGFISDAHRLRPELPICVASAWSGDLPRILQTLETLAPPVEVY
jgi:hypothetical protein